MKEKKNKSEKVFNGSCIYTPGGAAREYAAVGCNFYRGCPYQCRYCYNRHGMTAKIMGLDHALLDDKFTSVSIRPKKYRELTGEEYAYMRFLQEVEKWQDYLRKTSIFFSFSTDPFCDECFDLTWRCMCTAVKLYSIPVKVLTKNADLSATKLVKIGMMPEKYRRLMAFGFTLTGRDDWEPFASKNFERIRLMRVLHGMGFKTFASIEPIVDFDSSYSMIEKTEKFCDQYLIGLMSSRKANGLESYDVEACKVFVSKVHNLMWCDYSQKKDFNRPTAIYWKESIRKLMECDTISSDIMKEGHSSTAVGRDWSLFTGKDVII